MASIIKRDTTRGPVYDVRYRDPEGVQRKKSFRRKALAQQYANKIEVDKTKGEYVDPRAGRITFREYAEKWRTNQAHHREGTATSVDQHLRLHVYPVLGNRPLVSITTEDIRALVKRLSTDSTDDDRKALAPSTLGIVYGRVVAVFRVAVEDGRIAKSPCTRGIKLPKPSAAKLEVLTTEQVMALADAMPARYRAPVIVGATTGLRPGELFGLTRDRLVEFLDPRAAAVRVDRQLVRVRGQGVRLGEPKTAASHRTVPLAQTTKDALAAHMAEFPPHPTLGLIFTNERGGPIQQYPFGVVWETARRKAGLPEWATPHDLRHYYASLLIQSGASVKTVQARLGHASAKTTLDTYGHLWPDEDDRTRAAVDAEFDTGRDRIGNLG